MGGFGTVAGKFDLQVCVSFSYASATLQAARDQFLLEFLQQVSKALFYATQGQHQLGTVFLCYDSTGSAQSDAILVDDAETESTDRRLWKPANGPFSYSKNHLPSVALFVHELGHYLYDVRDEYQGPGTGTCSEPAVPNPAGPNADLSDYECIPVDERPVEDACLMDAFGQKLAAAWLLRNDPNQREIYAAIYDLLSQKYLLPGDPDYSAPTYATSGYADGSPSQFCSSGNHTGQLHYQNVCHSGDCCWVTLADSTCHDELPYGLVEPAAQPQVALVLTAPDLVNVVVTLPTQRYATLLDRSGSMAGDKISRLHDGAAFWVDYVEQTEQLALLSFATAASHDRALSTVPLDTDATQAGWRSDRTGVVTGLLAGGLTAIGSGLRAALQEIQSQARAASQAIILFSDGLENFGTESAEQVLPDLLAAGVRLYVVGLGDDQDPLLLQNLAERTGGQYLAIDSSLSPREASFEIQDFLTLVAGVARDDSEVSAFNSPPIPVPGPDYWPPPDWGSGESLAPNRIDAPVWISRGCTHCTIGAVAPSDLSALEFRLFDPNGDEVTVGRADTRTVRWQHGHAFWSIRNPPPGSWSIVIQGSFPTEPGWKVFAFETNPRVSLEVILPQGRVAPGSSVRVRARLRAPLPVRATDVRARFLGSKTSTPLRPEGDVGAYGDLVAEHVIDLPVPDNALGPQTILVDVVHEEHDAVYPRGRFCGSDLRPLDGRATSSVRIEKIVRRYVGTVIVGTPAHDSSGSMLRRLGDSLLGTFRRLIGAGDGESTREIRRGISPPRSWVHPDQKRLVEEWKRTYRRS